MKINRLVGVSFGLLIIASLSSVRADEGVKNTSECNGLLSSLQEQFHLTPMDQGYYHSIASKMNQNFLDAMSKAPDSIKNEYAALVAGKLKGPETKAGVQSISDYLANSPDLGQQWAKDYICPEGTQAHIPQRVSNGDLDNDTYWDYGGCRGKDGSDPLGNLLSFKSMNSDGTLQFRFGIPDTQNSEDSVWSPLIRGADYRMKVSSKGMDVAQLTTLLAQSSNKTIDPNAPATIHKALQKASCIESASPDQARSLLAIDQLKSSSPASASGVSTEVSQKVGVAQ